MASTTEENIPMDHSQVWDEKHRTSPPPPKYHALAAAFVGSAALGSERIPGDLFPGGRPSE